jgi:DNA-binding response OmpR family regulator
MERILIVEDEVKISRLIELQLKHEGYVTDTAFDGAEGLSKIEKNNYDLVLLDLMLPRIDGIEVCNRVRKFSDIPIIMLTAKDDVRDKVSGLDTGADDYLTKPFVFEELSARIRANLRKQRKDKSKEIIKVNDLMLNKETFEVTRDGKIVELSKTEFDLLYLLMENKGIVLTREKILNRIWGYDYFGSDNILDVYIKYLRDKVDKPFDKKLIKTVRGVGYTIKEEN